MATMIILFTYLQVLVHPVPSFFLFAFLEPFKSSFSCERMYRCRDPYDGEGDKIPRAGADRRP